MCTDTIAHAPASAACGWAAANRSGPGRAVVSRSPARTASSIAAEILARLSSAASPPASTRSGTTSSEWPWTRSADNEAAESVTTATWPTSGRSNWLPGTATNSRRPPLPRRPPELQHRPGLRHHQGWNTARARTRPGLEHRPGLERHRLAATPYPVWLQAVRPGECALVVSVPGDDVSKAIAGHGAPVSCAQRLRGSDGGRAQRLGDAHPEVGHGQADHQWHRGDPVGSRRVAGAQRERHAPVEQGPDRRGPAIVGAARRAHHCGYAGP